MKRPYPKNVFPRGGKLSIKVRLRDGSWKQVATGLDLEQGAAAGALQRRTQERLDSGQIETTGPITVAEWSRRWLAAREAQGTIATIADDKGRIKNHLWPTVLARMPIVDVRPRHVRAWLHSLRETVGVPRTIRNIAILAGTMFKEAVIDEVIPTTPYVLRRGDLPPIVDADPEWRANAIFTRAELELVISDERIAVNRRMLYAILFLTGMRVGEALALRWRHWSTELQPLGRLIVAGSYSTTLKREKSTKTQAVRRVPVHTVLSSLLAWWKLVGWELTYGRKPTDDDLIVPSMAGEKGVPSSGTRHRNRNRVLKQFDIDLTTLGLRHRRVHDTRRTLRSLLADDGGSERAIEWILYGRKATVSGRYDEPSWPALCEPVLKLSVKLRNQPVADLGAEWCSPREQRKGARK
jgi:integrase